MDEQLQVAAAVFKAMGEPNRLRILRFLSDVGAEGSTCENVSATLELSHSLTSHHLKILRLAGLITQQRNGLHRINRLVVAESTDAALRTYLTNLVLLRNG